MRFIPRFSITNAIAAALTEIERTRGFLDAASLSDEWIDSMRSRAFLLEAHHTTHIEGTRLTIEEAADLLAGDDVPGADPDDTRELLNYRDAFKFVSTYLNDGGPITRQWHRVRPPLPPPCPGYPDFLLRYPLPLAEGGRGERQRAPAAPAPPQDPAG